MIAKKTSPALTDAPMLVRDAASHGFLRANQSFLRASGFSTQQLSSKPLLNWIVPEDRDAVESLLKKGGRCRAGHLSSHGPPIMLDLRSDESRVVLGCATFSDTTSCSAVEAEASVPSTLHTIASILEQQYPEFKCSILLVADGRFVRGAGPSLSEEYNSAIDGFAIGPTVGSCGTAIYWNLPVIVEDIQNDPLWTPFRELAAKEGVAACWSHPFTSKGGRVLGALAFYCSEVRKPTPQQLSALRAAARLTGLAVERGRAEEALREKRKRELELEDQLRQAAKMEALGVLAGGVAHDFNNVLTSILANAEFAQSLCQSDEEMMAILSDIVEASTRAGSFCTQMLAYAGRGTLRTTQVELGGLLPQLSALVSAALSKKTTLEYALLEEPIYVEGDENQLLQVVMNLITNAAEAIGESGGEIRLSSSLETLDSKTIRQLSGGEELPTGEYVKLEVQDTGCGMPASVAEKIFDPFFTTKFTGRGLGLAAVKGIVLRHGGVIFLSSTPGKGTTFTILLPTVAAPAKTPLMTKSRVGKSTEHCVLIVDDERAIRKILNRRLTREGFRLLEACDGHEAIQVFSENRDAIDCVLLDLSMPKLGGEEVCRKLLEMRPDIPVIVMSGHAAGDVVMRLRDTSISGTLQKPFCGEDLLSAVYDSLGPEAARRVLPSTA